MKQESGREPHAILRSDAYYQNNFRAVLCVLCVFAVKKLLILHSDSQIVVVNKPPGIAVHDAPGVGVSLLRELRERHQLDGLTPVHRLDKDASGVLVLARSTEIAAEFQRRWGEAEKFYLALCEGAPDAETGTIDAPILENQSSKPERLERAVRYYKKMNPDVSLSPLPKPKTSGVHVAGRSSQTEFRVIKRFRKGARSWSWLELRPRQGRMHQIRVQSALREGGGGVRAPQGPRWGRGARSTRARSGRLAKSPGVRAGVGARDGGGRESMGCALHVVNVAVEGRTCAAFGVGTCADPRVAACGHPNSHHTDRSQRTRRRS